MRKGIRLSTQCQVPMRAKLVSFEELMLDEGSDPEAPLDMQRVSERREKGKKLGLPPSAIDLLEEDGRGAMLALWSDELPPPLE